MTDPSRLPESHRQLLVRCQVTNASGEPGLRFVEHSLYRLWQYLMANKHHIRVVAADVCLWLPGAEWKAQEELFSRAGTVEAVHRISIAVYDGESSYCNTMQRFVAADDAERVRALLLRRLPEDTRRAGDFAMELETGYAVVRDDITDLARLGRTFDTTG